MVCVDTEWYVPLMAYLKPCYCRFIVLCLYPTFLPKSVKSEVWRSSCSVIKNIGLTVILSVFFFRPTGLFDLCWTINKQWTKKIPLLWDTNFRNRVHWKADNGHYPKLFNQIHNFTPCFFKNHVFLSASVSPKWSFYMQLLAQNFICIFLPSMSFNFIIFNERKNTLCSSVTHATRHILVLWLFLIRTFPMSFILLPPDLFQFSVITWQDPKSNGKQQKRSYF